MHGRIPLTERTMPGAVQVSWRSRVAVALFFYVLVQGIFIIVAIRIREITGVDCSYHPKIPA